jgi:hypothetical protein
VTMMTRSVSFIACSYSNERWPITR